MDKNNFSLNNETINLIVIRIRAHAKYLDKNSYNNKRKQEIVLTLLKIANGIENFIDEENLTVQLNDDLEIKEIIMDIIVSTLNKFDGCFPSYENESITRLL